MSAQNLEELMAELKQAQGQKSPADVSVPPAPIAPAPAPEVAPIEAAPVQPTLSPKEQYIQTQYIPSRNIQAPSIGSFDESPQQRADRIAREASLNSKLDAAKAEHEKESQAASDRQFNAEIFAALGNYLPHAIAGATAMNTKAAVKAPDLPKIAVKDHSEAEDKKYKTEYEKILNQYKQLKSGEMTPAQRASLTARYDQMNVLAQIAGQNGDQRAQSSKNSEEEKFEKKVEGFGKATENNARAYNALGAIDDVLKSAGIDNIDNLKVENGKVLGKEGKEVDLPGASVPGLGRVTIGNDKAQNLESTMSTVFNTELKDRSGASVTSPELDRLKTEFGQGKFNTESQMVAALQRYKKLASQALKSAESRYEKPIVEEAKARGMTTSDSFIPKITSPSQDTKTVNGITYKKTDGGWAKVK